MTRNEVIAKAMQRKISWRQASVLLGVSERHIRRLRRRIDARGLEGLVDGRSLPRKKRVSDAVVAELCRLRRDVYRDFSVAHFHEFATQKHGLRISYTKAKCVLQNAGLAMKAPGRGKYRRRRERRPMRGMMLHLDASTHAWIDGLPSQDLVVMLDDASGEILYACFFEQEGVLSTLHALKSVLQQHGRFSELYTDRGSHFCTTTFAKLGPNQFQSGTLARILYALRIKHILAFSPQARGRSERAFGTIQGRLPQELRLAKIRSYSGANKYLQQTFIPAFNKRFGIRPAQAESAFTPVKGVDLDLLVSVQHARVVKNDNTVLFDKRILQLGPDAQRCHYARCEVLVHEFANEDLGVSYNGRLLLRVSRDGLKRRKLKPTPKTGPRERYYERTSVTAYAP